jgi:hypothetical protein
MKHDVVFPPGVPIAQAQVHILKWLAEAIASGAVEPIPMPLFVELMSHFAQKFAESAQQMQKTHGGGEGSTPQ